jgi:hypothetical protein
VEDFKFSTGLLTTSATISLDAAGLSLLTANLQVLNSRGQVVASSITTDPTNNNLSITLNHVQPLTTFYVQVSAAQNNVFGIGSYRLSIAQDSLLTGVTGLVNQLLLDTGLNSTLATAVNLLTGGVTAGSQTHYNDEGCFGAKSDVEYYRIADPVSAGSGPANLLVTIWGENGETLNPWIEVENALGKPLPMQVFSANGNATILQVSGLQPGGIYYIRAASDTGAIGAYELSADVGTPAVQLPQLGSGTLTPSIPHASGGFAITVTAQVHLVASASGSSGSLALTVDAASGQPVAELTASANRTRSLDLILPAGQYTVAVQSSTGSTLSYSLEIVAMSEPIGAQPGDPTQSPEPTSPPPPPVPSDGSSTTTSSNGAGDPSTQTTTWWSSASSNGVEQSDATSRSTAAASASGHGRRRGKGR